MLLTLWSRVRSPTVAVWYAALRNDGTEVGHARGYVFSLFGRGVAAVGGRVGEGSDGESYLTSKLRTKSIFPSRSRNPERTRTQDAVLMSPPHSRVGYTNIWSKKIGLQR